MRRDVGEVYVQMFDVALANWVGEPPSLCIHSETCGLALALEHTGDLYRRPLRRARATSSATSRRSTCSTSLLRRSSDSSGSTSANAAAVLPRVRRRFACHGGCPKDRFIETPDGDPGLNYLCAGFKDSSIMSTGRCGSWPSNAARARPVGDRRAVRGRGRPPRTQRSLHVRLRAQMEAMPRSRRYDNSLGVRSVSDRIPALDRRTATPSLGGRRGAGGPRRRLHRRLAHAPPARLRIDGRGWGVARTREARERSEKIAEARAPSARSRPPRPGRESAGAR